MDVVKWVMGCSVMKLWGSSVHEEFTLDNGLQLLVKSGDVTSEAAGGVVVGEDEDFSGRGAVAHALLKAGGEEYIHYRNQLKDNIKTNGVAFPIYSCPAGVNLRYKYVLHAIITYRRKQPKQRNGQLKGFFFDMGRIAEEKGLRDIVTPLLGTGKAKKPLNVVLEEALDGLSMLQPKSLQRVILVESDCKKAETIRVHVTQILSSGTSTDPQDLRDAGNGSHSHAGHTEGRGESEKGRADSLSSYDNISLPGESSCSMPDGKMVATTKPSLHLGGFPDCGTLVIEYSFPNGVQGSQHPAPGQPYKGIFRRAFLPDNQEGQDVLQLLQTAFHQKLTFQLVQTGSTGEWGVEFADIPHKTSLRGGQQGNGYPDHLYLSQVKTALKKYDLF